MIVNCRMVKGLKILALVSVIVLLGAPSCEDEGSIEQRKEDELRTTRSLILQEFEADHPSVTDLAAHEAGARLKLADVSDYLKIIADTSLDAEFRKQAANLLQRIFITGDTRLNIHPAISEKEITLSDLISSALANNIHPILIGIEDVEMTPLVYHRGSGSYTGLMFFSLTLPTGSGMNTTSVKKKAEYFLLKEDKLFGSDTLKIWNVKLGRITEEK